MLSITSTPGRIGIQTTNAKLELHSPKGEQSITTTKPQLKINGSFPNIQIEKSQTNYEYGIRTSLEVLEEGASLGKQSAYQAIGRIVSDGNRLKDIRIRVPAAVPELAMQNSQQPQGSLDIKLIGTTRPKTEVVGGYDIDFELGTVNAEYTPRKVEGNYNAGKVEVYMQQYPDINISYNIDTSA